MLEFPPIRPGEPLTISASAFVAYRQCPTMAAARFQGVYGPDSVAAFRGGLAHAVFARHLTEGPIEGDTFVTTCKQLIGSSSLNHKVAGLRLRPSEVSSAIEEARELYERFKKLPEAGFEGAEELIEVAVADGVILKGRIDAIYGAEGGVRLVDWKTGNLGEPADQLRFYALLWYLDRSHLPSSIEAYSVRTGEVHQSVLSDADVAETADEVAEMVDTIREAWDALSDLAPRGGPWCRYCPLLPTCEEGQATVGLIDGHPRRTSTP